MPNYKYVTIGIMYSDSGRGLNIYLDTSKRIAFMEKDSR